MHSGTAEPARAAHSGIQSKHKYKSTRISWDRWCHNSSTVPALPEVHSQHVSYLPARALRCRLCGTHISFIPQVEEYWARGRVLCRCTVRFIAHIVPQFEGFLPFWPCALHVNPGSQDLHQSVHRRYVSRYMLLCVAEAAPNCTQSRKIAQQRTRPKWSRYVSNWCTLHLEIKSSDTLDTSPKCRAPGPRCSAYAALNEKASTVSSNFIVSQPTCM